MKTILIDSQFVKDNSTVDNNVSNTIIRPTIIFAQENHIQLALGQNLYEKIVEDFESGSLAGIYEDIYDYIQPALLEFSVYYLIPRVAVRITNKGANRSHSEDSSTSSISEMKYLRQDVLNMAQFYLKRLNTFLKDNKNDIPQLKDMYNQNPQKSNKSYFNGIHFPK